MRCLTSNMQHFTENHRIWVRRIKIQEFHYYYCYYYYYYCGPYNSQLWHLHKFTHKKMLSVKIIFVFVCYVCFLQINWTHSSSVGRCRKSVTLTVQKLTWRISTVKEFLQPTLTNWKRIETTTIEALYCLEFLVIIICASVKKCLLWQTSQFWSFGH